MKINDIVTKKLDESIHRGIPFQKHINNVYMFIKEYIDPNVGRGVFEHVAKEYPEVLSRGDVAAANDFLEYIDYDYIITEIDTENKELSLKNI